ncbi:MAG: T9SS type A sorting domain-containing protein, partial [Chitinophagales bacterium]|nr:T9SS type A sorting domain-containing protein [Chitinophagales bacterium]
ATSVALTGLFGGTTYQYRAEAICNSGPTGYSAIQEFATSGTTYCATGGTNATKDWIDLVYVGDFLNSTPDSEGGYSDFTYLTAELQQGETYSFTLSAGMVGGPFMEYWRVWIDFNGDGDFIDAGENIVSYNSDQVGWESHDFTVPPTAEAGTTLMRVSMKRGSAPAPCGTFAKGETEDYTVNILPAKKAVVQIAPVAELVVYPNPATDILHMQLNNWGENVFVQIADMNGKEMLNTAVNKQVGELNISSLQAGFYFLITTDEAGNRSVIKLIKN